MGKKILRVYLAKNDTPYSAAYAKLELPASPWEVWDAMDKVRLNEGEQLYMEIEDYYAFAYLASHLAGLDISLNELNDLAERLAKLDEVQGIAYRGLLEMAVQEKVESNGGIITLRLIRCGVGTNRALDMGITNKAFDAYEQSLIRVRAFLTSLRGWRSKTRPMKKSCLCAPCSPSCTVATQRNSSPRNISSPVRSGWRRINSSTRSSLRGGKRCFRRSRCLPRGKRGFPRRLPAPAR